MSQKNKIKNITKSPNHPRDKVTIEINNSKNKYRMQGFLTGIALCFCICYIFI